MTLIRLKESDKISMKKLFVLLLFFSIFSIIYAQENEEEEEDSPSINTVQVYQPIRKEDKYIKMGVSLNSPLFNTSNKRFAIPTKIYPGGSFYFGFAYFLTNGFSLGVSLSFDFYLTLGTNLYFAVPFTFDMMYTFAVGKWRFPLGMGIGGDFQTYNSTKYFSLIFRPETGFYYQYSPDWSFGATFSWCIVPQWYKNRDDNRTGNILGISFAARYHF